MGYRGLPIPSRKQWLRCRRIRLNAPGEVFTVAPALVMPVHERNGSGGTKGVVADALSCSVLSHCRWLARQAALTPVGG